MTLRSKLDSAKVRFVSSAQNKVTGLALADQRIGKSLAGSYDLTCHQNAPVASADNLPAKLVITHNGSLIATSAFGNVSLLAGAGNSNISTFNNQLLFSHTLYTYRALASAKTKLNRDGILINVLLPTVANADELGSFLVETISSTGDGVGTISIDNNQWTCSGFPQATAEQAIADTQLSLWLPDGDYVCQDEKINIQNRIMTFEHLQNTTALNVVGQREERFEGYSYADIQLYSYYGLHDFPSKILPLIAKKPNSFTQFGQMLVILADGTRLAITHSSSSELGYFSRSDSPYNQQCINTALLK